MIKLGDYVVLKKDIDRAENKPLIGGMTFPLKVDKITACPWATSNDLVCSECPGYINDHICFGYKGQFVIEPLRDWDE